MGAGAVWVIPIAMVFDINALGGFQAPPCEYLSDDRGLMGYRLPIRTWKGGPGFSLKKID